LNKEVIEKLIDFARTAADNAYCPYSEVPEGASLLTFDNIIFSGCNVELSSRRVSAGEVAILKASSDGKNSFVTLCLWAESITPIPSGALLDIAAEFNIQNFIVATGESYAIYKLHELLPIRRITEGA